MNFQEALSKAIDTAEKKGTIKPARAARARKRLAEKSAKDLRTMEGRVGKFAGADGRVGAIDWSTLLPLLIQLLPILLALFGL